MQHIISCNISYHACNISYHATYHIMLATYHIMQHIISYHATYHIMLATYHIMLATYHIMLATYHIMLATYHIISCNISYHILQHIISCLQHIISCLQHMHAPAGVAFRQLSLLLLVHHRLPTRGQPLAADGIRTRQGEPRVATHALAHTLTLNPKPYLLFQSSNIALTHHTSRYGTFASGPIWHLCPCPSLCTCCC
jgi:hypothetical protein